MKTVLDEIKPLHFQGAVNPDYHIEFCVCAVRRELRSLLDSLLHLQQRLLSRHTDTQSLVAMGTSTGVGDREEEALSDDDDEEVPSDLGSDEEGDDREGGEEGAVEGVGEGESQNQKRQRRKRKCPWVR